MVKIHSVFHISVLCSAASVSDALLKQIQDPLPPIKVDGKDKYFVKRVDNIKYDKQKHQYMYFIK